MALYDDSLYQVDRPQPSWWEASLVNDPAPVHLQREPLTTQESADVAIVGGGYTGLAAAWRLAERYNLDVRVLEAGHIGWGASGRNGGFCCPGGVKLSLATQRRRFGDAAVREYLGVQAEAVETVREIGALSGIDLMACGDGEWQVAETAAQYRALVAQQAELASLGVDAALYDRDEFREHGYDAPHQQGALLQRPAFGLHPLRLVQALATLAGNAGARLHARSAVHRHERLPDGRHRVQTVAGSVTARHLVVTCNGFLPEAIFPDHAARSIPVQSNILLTRPLSDDELAAHGWHTFSPLVNSRHLFNYYRLLPDRRFLFGARGGIRGSDAEAQQVFADMHASLSAAWPAWSHVDITHRWRGLILLNSHLRPCIGRLAHDACVFHAFGYQGNGVNNATWSGLAVADWLAGEHSGDVRGRHLPVMMRTTGASGLPPRIRPAWSRKPILRAMLAQYRWRDRFDRR